MIITVQCMYGPHMFEIKMYGDQKGAEGKLKKEAKCIFLCQRSLVIMSPGGTGGTCDRDGKSVAVSPREGKDAFSMKYIICANT